jgi:LacI family transcriptional regulator, gluconate utilization system Gnt-I transcriptional repressor
MMPPRKPPTMVDIARATGVSPMTVSRAFKSEGAISAAKRAEILAVAERLGYVFDVNASNLRSQKSGFVAATVPSLNNANFADTLRGLTEGLGAKGMQILLGYTDYDTAKEEQLIEQLLRRRPEAIVVTGGTHTPRARRMLAAAGIPVVETWDMPRDPIGHVVGFSNAAAVDAMVGHLVGKGLTRIAFIGGDADRDTRGSDRRVGFIAAMKARNLVADRLIAAGAPPISMREGANAMATLLAQFPDTQAVICVSDLSAFGALTECQRRGIAVPDQIALAGFGDYEIAGVCVPGLTTMNANAHAIGLRTAGVILDVLAGVQDGPVSTEIPPHLIIRASTG